MSPHFFLDAASAAFEIGYESPTQFSSEYSRSFGQPPIRDIRTPRESGGTAAEQIINGDWGSGQIHGGKGRRCCKSL